MMMMQRLGRSSGRSTTTTVGNPLSSQSAMDVSWWCCRYHSTTTSGAKKTSTTAGKAAGGWSLKKTKSNTQNHHQQQDQQHRPPPLADGSVLPKANFITQAARAEASPKNTLVFMDRARFNKARFSEELEDPTGHLPPTSVLLKPETSPWFKQIPLTSVPPDTEGRLQRRLSMLDDYMEKHYDEDHVLNHAFSKDEKLTHLLRRVLAKLCREMSVQAREIKHLQRHLTVDIQQLLAERGAGGGDLVSYLSGNDAFCVVRMSEYKNARNHKDLVEVQLSQKEGDRHRQQPRESMQMVSQNKIFEVRGFATRFGTDGMDGGFQIKEVPQGALMYREAFVQMLDTDLVLPSTRDRGVVAHLSSAVAPSKQKWYFIEIDYYRKRADSIGRGFYFIKKFVHKHHDTDVAYVRMMVKPTTSTNSGGNETTPSTATAFPTSEPSADASSSAASSSPAETSTSSKADSGACTPAPLPPQPSADTINPNVVLADEWIVPAVIDALHQRGFYKKDVVTKHARRLLMTYEFERRMAPHGIVDQLEELDKPWETFLTCRDSMVLSYMRK